MDVNLIIWVALALPLLGLLLGALLPAVQLRQSKRRRLVLRIAGFLLFAPSCWCICTLMQAGVINMPTREEMLLSALATALLYLTAVGGLRGLRQLWNKRKREKRNNLMP